MWARLQSPADAIGFDAEPLSGGRRANAGAPDDGSGLDPRGADRHAGGVAARHHGVQEDIDRGRTVHPAHDLAFEGAADLAGGAPLSLVVLGMRSAIPWQPIYLRAIATTRTAGRRGMQTKPPSLDAVASSRARAARSG
jgi:hypothetical protein